MPEVVSLDNVTLDFDVSKPWLIRLLSRLPRRTLRAVDNVSFGIESGTTLGLVGESGCGKSTVAKLVAGLYAPSSGQIAFGAASARNGKTPPRLGMVFQDPFASLNPRWKVGRIVTEPLRTYGLVPSRKEGKRLAGDLLRRVGLSPADQDKFPHQFSGGQRQRISIARAISVEPSLMIFDEPTSALDVSVQAQILNLMSDLQKSYGLTYLFISHNLAVVRHMADALAVMYLGRIVEKGRSEAVFSRPQHPYTRLLLAAVPDVRATGHAPSVPIEGELPNPIDPPAGCSFHPRCPLADDRCRREIPALAASGEALVACHAVHEKRAGSVVPLPSRGNHLT